MKLFSLQVLLLVVVGIFTGVFMTSSDAGAVVNNSLTVTIEGLKNQEGQVCLSLFSSAQGFPDESDRAVASRCIRAESIPLSVTFSNLSPGNYAVAVIHDANNDGKLNTGFLGIPKEGIGFSQNPRLRFSAPSFEDTSLSISELGIQAQVQLKYF
jgi:uncharacterized protein (DUF2141 family)